MNTHLKVPVLVTLACLTALPVAASAQLNPDRPDFNQQLSADDWVPPAICDLDADGKNEALFVELRTHDDVGNLIRPTASVVALTDVHCYRLDKKAFDAIIRARPELAHEVSTVLAARRVGLIAAQEGLEGEARTAREKSEQARLVHGIRSFFGLEN